MGYVPEWARGSQAKTSTKVEHGIKKHELFHNAPKPGSNAKQNPFNRHYADGGEVELNVKGEKIGQYDGDDEIVKYRMNQIDEKGNDLRIPKSAMTTTSQAEAQDMENGPGIEPTPTPTAQAQAQDNESGYKSSPAAAPARKTATKAKPVGSKLVEEPDGSEPDPGPSFTTIPPAKLAPTAKDQLASLRRNLRGEGGNSFSEKLGKLQGKKKA